MPDDVLTRSPQTTPEPAARRRARSIPTASPAGRAGPIFEVWRSGWADSGSA